VGAFMVINDNFYDVNKY